MTRSRIGRFIGIALATAALSVAPSAARAQWTSPAGFAPVRVSSIGSDLPPVSGDCGQPSWAKTPPVDWSLTYHYKPGVGSGSTQTEALRNAEADASRGIETSVYGYVTYVSDYRNRVGSNTDRVPEVIRSSVSRVSISSIPGERQSEFCQLADGRTQVWVLRGIEWRRFFRLLVQADPDSRDIDFLQGLRDWTRVHAPASRPSRVLLSAVSPGTVQYRDGKRGLGRFVRYGATIGGAAAILTHFLASSEADKARGVTNSQARQDYYRQRSDQLYGASRIAWGLAGLSYSIGIVDALSGGPKLTDR